MTRDYLEFLTSDLLMQFRGRDCPNNRIFLSAIAKQLDDLFEAFNQIGERTYLKQIKPNETGEALYDGAHGIHLDRIGEIVDLTRKQATLVSNKIKSVSDIDSSGAIQDDTLLNFIKHNFSVYYPQDSLSDEEYSEYLYYKIFLNNSYCVYDDVIKSLTMFWDNSDIYYQEKTEHPATIYLSTPELKPEQNSRLFFLAPVVKSGGVGLLRESATKYPMQTAITYVGGAVFSGLIQTTLPYLLEKVEVHKDINVADREEGIIETILAVFDNGILFEEIEGGYRATAKECKENTLVYPMMFNGKNVVSVGMCHSRITENTESVLLPLGAKEIVENAFTCFDKVKRYDIPASVDVIGKYAFSFNVSLVIVNFDPESKISVLPQNLCFGCTSLETVVLPSSLKKIEDDAFAVCDKLKTVIFYGSAEEWDAVDKGNNSVLDSAELIFV